MFSSNQEVPSLLESDLAVVASLSLRVEERQPKLENLCHELSHQEGQSLISRKFGVCRIL